MVPFHSTADNIKNTFFLHVMPYSFADMLWTWIMCLLIPTYSTCKNTGPQPVVLYIGTTIIYSTQLHIDICSPYEVRLPSPYGQLHLSQFHITYTTMPQAVVKSAWQMAYEVDASLHRLRQNKIKWNNLLRWLIHPREWTSTSLQQFFFQRHSSPKNSSK